MPKTEVEFQHFLTKIGCCFEKQAVVEHCPFLKRGKHKVDFRVTSARGEELYVEVKGYLSFYSVNVLEYLLRYSGKAFYVFQVTDEDWMGVAKQGQSVQEKIDQNKRRQEDEIGRFIRGDLVAQVMVERSLQRLKDYKKLRACEVERWRKMAMNTNQRKGGSK